MGGSLRLQPGEARLGAGVRGKDQWGNWSNSVAPECEKRLRALREAAPS
jgi:hypothetical protein